MSLSYTPAYLHKLETLVADLGYVLRYEKGNFKAGYCVLRDTRVAVVNKYFPLEGKITCLLEMLRSLPVDVETLTEKNRKLYAEIVPEVSA